MMLRVKFPNVANLRHLDADEVESNFDRRDQRARAANEVNIYMRLSEQWGGLDSISKEHK